MDTIQLCCIAFVGTMGWDSRVGDSPCLLESVYCICSLLCFESTVSRMPNHLVVISESIIAKRGYSRRAPSNTLPGCFSLCEAACIIAVVMKNYPLQSSKIPAARVKKEHVE